MSGPQVPACFGFTIGVDIKQELHSDFVTVLFKPLIFIIKFKILLESQVYAICKNDMRNSRNVRLCLFNGKL